MSALSVEPPFPVFADADGQPLEDGFINVGVVNLNPITNPIAVFFDAALTIPASQPIRTLGGYPVYQGTPTRFYVGSDCSIQVKDKKGSVVYTSLNGNIITLNDINFLQAGTGAVTRTALSKMREIVSVTDFGAVGDGVTNDSVAFQNAINSIANAQSGIINVPQGTFYIGTSLNLASNLQIIGAGKGVTTLKGAPRIAPNGNTSSSNILTGTSVTNVVLKDMTFDGGIYGPTYLNGNLPALALVDFETSENVTVENCDLLGFVYSDDGSLDPATSNYKVGALFAYDSSYISVKNVEYVSPTYGNLIMFIECTHVMVDGAKSTFTNTGVNIINETPLNIWGDDCQYVTIQNCEFANIQGSAINLGGKGSFIIKNNRFYDGVGAVAGGIDLTNENWVSATPPEMYNVIIDGNTFTDLQSTIGVGDVRSGEAVTTHEVVITNNTYQMTAGGDFGSILLGNSDFAIISDNSLNGCLIQLNYNNVCSVQGNTMYGRQIADKTGIAVYCRAAEVDSYQYIRKNIISDFSLGTLSVYGFFAAPYTNIVYSENDMLYTGAYTPTSGRYITVIPSGGNPAYIPGDFTISGNRLNGASYIPFRLAGDTEIFATKYYTGSLTTKIGTFSRDTTIASGTQSVTGVGFKPRAIIFFACQSGTGEASFGFSDVNLLGTSGENGVVNSRTATSPGTFFNNVSSILAFESAGNTYAGNIDTLDNDGFTINWVRVGTPSGTLEVTYLALA
jgi:hypothetical protein